MGKGFLWKSLAWGGGKAQVLWQRRNLKALLFFKNL